MEAEFATQFQMPTVLVICGPPCSGKTTIARQIRQRPEFASFAYFEMDELRLSLSPSSHTPEDRAAAYSRMHDLAAEALRTGAPGAMLVATYQPSEQRRAARTFSDGLAARMVVFECWVSPEEAVKRFQCRSEAHAATDLSAERVWDLVHDFRYFEKATRLDTLSNELTRLIHTVVSRVQSRSATDDLDAWIDHGNPAQAREEIRRTPTSTTPMKLTAGSRSHALRKWAFRRVVYFTSFASAIAAVMVLINELRPGFAGFTLPGEAAEWIQAWAAVAVLASGVLLLWEQLFEKPEAQTLKTVKTAGRVPRLSLLEASPSNADLYRRYRRRIEPGHESRLLLEGVPLWFVVLPRPNGFEVRTKIADLVPLDTALLRRRASSIGLEWSAYLKWRENQKKEEYFDRSRELNVRALDIKEANDSVTLTVCKGSFMSYLCTELSANLYIEGRSGFEMRQVFEGPPWIQSDLPKRKDKIDLGDLMKASRTYEMLVGVQVALTTKDGYLILQRRSDLVQSAVGGVASSGAGSAQWKDLKSGLTETALREIREEIGWVPHADDDLSAPFLGAAFNLLRGRDLNFYSHFHTHWELKDISAGPEHWHHRIPAWLNRRPMGANRAPYAWEVAHIFPVPIDVILPDGTLRAPFSSTIGDARHLRGLLYCLAQSEKFRALQNEMSR